MFTKGYNNGTQCAPDECGAHQIIQKFGTCKNCEDDEVPSYDKTYCIKHPTCKQRNYMKKLIQDDGSCKYCMLSQYE